MRALRQNPTLIDCYEIASAATSIVIGHIAAGTKTIRVGAGGIMLPNHAPYVIAEQFGTLARLFPGRIDLGLAARPEPTSSHCALCAARLKPLKIPRRTFSKRPRSFELIAGAARIAR